ncbi:MULTISPECIES: hypothetical protein [Streptomyces]|jgi:hypothetical protein|nr:hypothetical protein [Streptomyces viridodiastaticus]MCX4564757.1 hypothetical protein [Streptomyces viridodiastaticus]
MFKSKRARVVALAGAGLVTAATVVPGVDHPGPDHAGRLENEADG